MKSVQNQTKQEVRSASTGLHESERRGDDRDEETRCFRSYFNVSVFLRRLEFHPPCAGAAGDERLERVRRRRSAALSGPGRDARHQTRIWIVNLISLFWDVTQIRRAVFLLHGFLGENNRRLNPAEL